MVKKIRGGSGLGDSIYVRSVVEHLLAKGESLHVCTKYPQVYEGLPVTTGDFRRNDIDIVAHYPSRKAEPTNQWQDICIRAGIGQDVEQSINWTAKNQGLIDKVRQEAAGRKIVIICAPHVPMGREDGFAKEVLPKASAFRDICVRLEDCFRILVGGDDPVFEVPHEFDLVRRTTVSDLFDLALACDAMVGQCGFIVPLAEAFHKPLMVIWGRAVERAGHVYVRQITPQKVLAGSRSRHIWDDWEDWQVAETISEFRSIF